MKKTLIIILCALILSSASCAAVAPTAQHSKDTYIQAVQLTEAELQLVTLLECGSFGISRFNADDPKKVEIIFDFYHDGVLINSKTYDSGTSQVADGKIAVVPGRSDANRIDVNMVAGRNNTIGWWLEEDYDTDKMLHTDIYNSTIKAAVKDGEIYVLFGRLFSVDQNMGVPADILDNTDALKAFDYTFIVSCRFSSEETGVTQ